MLAHVASARLRDPRHLAKYARHVGQVAGAHGMDHKIESAGPEPREVVHRALEDFHLQSPLPGHRTIEIEHRRRDIDDGHPGAGGGVERPVLPAAGREAEHLEPIEPFGQPRPAAVPAAPEPAARIAEGLVHRGLGKGRVRRSEPIPGPLVVGENRVAGSP